MIIDEPGFYKCRDGEKAVISYVDEGSDYAFGIALHITEPLIWEKDNGDLYEWGSNNVNREYDIISKWQDPEIPLDFDLCAECKNRLKTKLCKHENIGGLGQTIEGVGRKFCLDCGIFDPEATEDKTCECEKIYPTKFNFYGECGVCGGKIVDVTIK